MRKLHIIHDIYDDSKNTVIECENVLACLKSEFKTFPTNARVYHLAWHEENDITEKLAKDNEYAECLEGDIIVVIYPTFLQFVLYAVVALTTILSVYTYMTMPKQTASVAGSSNNELSSRQNQPRLGGRVPEIFGTLRAVPDMISPAFVYYEDDIEIEECLMCLGRGYYEIHDVKDDTTNILDIEGAAVSFYNPNTNLTGTPFYSVGDAFTAPPLLTVKSKAINGQSLEIPNEQIIESDEITFKYPNIIKSNDPTIDFTTMFEDAQAIGVYGAEFLINDVVVSEMTTLTTSRRVQFTSVTDVVDFNQFERLVVANAIVPVTVEIPPVPPATDPTYQTNYYDLSGRYRIASITKTAVSGGFYYNVLLSNAEMTNPNWNLIDTNKNVNTILTFAENVNSINLNGTYLTNTVTANQITLSNPASTNDDWLKLSTIPNMETQEKPDGIRLDKIENKWVGWFNVDLDNTEILIFNFHFPNGLFYQDSKGGVWEDFAELRVQYQYIDSEDVPYGAIYDIDWTEAAANKAPFSRTKRIELPEAGRVRFRTARSDVAQNGKTQNSTKIKDVYAAASSTVLHYRDITVVRTKTLGTGGALAIKERKLNTLVTRKLQVNGTGALTPTNSAAQALINLALDSRNGRRSITEIDVSNILDVEQQVINYFGSELASEFSYTFDDDNLSFEEMAGMVASTVFCEAYRYGSKIRWSFEKPQTNSVMLFNHTNKMPNSETRTKRFGIDNNYDGVQVEYSSPDDDTRITYIASDVLNPFNVKVIKTSGIRSHEQAKTRAWREWNKLKYQSTSVEFEAWEESSLLARQDRILVADNTRIDTIDGEVEAVNGLRLSLSQPVPYFGSYNIFIQLPDKTVDNIYCTVIDEYTVQLNRMPSVNLAIGRATYQLILSSSPEPQPFLMTELRPQGKMTNTLTCINYDSRYYQNDHDYF